MTAGGNPLVAQAQSQTTGVTGIGIAESAVDLANGVSDGSWVEAGLGAVGVGLEVLSLVVDPIGTLASYGVSWLIEHVQPLKEALDWLAGDPPVIQSFSDTWANVAAEVNAIAGDLGNEVTNGTAGWQGGGAEAYRGAAAEQADALAGAASLADGISAGVMIMGTVVAAVRELVRDLVAELVGKLITWALEAAGTLGFATPVIAVQATTAISKTITKISDFIRKLVKTIGNVSPKIRKIIDKLGEIIEKLSKMLRRGGKPGGGTTPSSAKPGTTKAPDTTPNSPDTTPSGTDTTPSGADAPGSKPSNGTSPSSTKPDGSSRPDDPNNTKTPEDQRRCENDPVDVVTGEMVLTNVDVELAGVLPLVLRRTHVSSYRAGRSFGRSWASTVDQRLEFDDQGVVLAAEDGMLLVYPVPPVRGEVLPEVGPTWPLSRTDTGFAVHRRETGLTLHFAAGATGVRPLSAIEDRNGNRIDIHRDSAGTPEVISHSGGYRIGVRSEAGRITELSLLAEGAEPVVLTGFRYHDSGDLAEVVNSSGRAFGFSYDHAGRITQWTDRNGEWYRYFYDADGRCVANQGSGGFLNGTFTYDTENRITRFTDALGFTTSYRFNEANQVVEETNPLGHTVVQEWDSRDRLLSRTDAIGRTSRWEYDEAGNPTVVTRPDGTQILTSYNEFGQPLSVVQPDGAVWGFEYDERGNLSAETDPAGAVTRYQHNERGHRVAVIDALGQARRIDTDNAGLPLRVTDPLGAVTRFTRDQFGRIVERADPMGGVTRFAWTVEGRLRSRTRPDGSTEHWRYDGQGSEVEHIDALGQVRRVETTHFDLPAAEIAPDGGRTEFHYDATLQLVSVTNPQGLVWRYEYDAAGHLLSETDFNGRVLRYTRDAAGQLVERVNGAGERVRITRDPMGNIVRREAGDEVTSFTYDPAGRIVSARNPDAELRYERDAAGRVLAETVNGATVASAYDLLGRRTARLTPTGARSEWAYDAAARPARLRTGGHTIAFGYDPAGREVERLLDSGTVLAQQWDVNQRLVSQTVSAVAPGARQARQLQLRNYRYRPDGHLVAVEDRFGGARHYDLDPVGRVLGVEGVDWRERYRYDRVGNVTEAEAPADAETTGPREYAGTLVRSAGRVSYRHDPQGRLVWRRKKHLSRKPEAWQYQWNADDRLVSVVTPDGTRWRYLYDPLGRRIAKLRLDAAGAVAERVDFAWDGNVLAEQVHSAGAATTWEYDPASFRPLTQTERAPLGEAGQQWVDRQFYSIVTDLVGTPTELVDGQGELVWHSRSTLWGEAAAAEHPGTPLRFPGQYFDAETGLHYNQHRYYDPVAGRYGSADPLGLLGGAAPHSYVHNPTGWTDALGLTESSDLEWVDANDVNFSQRTVSPNDYAEAMRNGEWDWERSPLRVMEVDGQLVSYDNRRLDAAREVGAQVAIQRVDPNAPDPASTTGRTWQESFQRRFRDPRNRGPNGEPVPDTGLSERPGPPGSCGGGGRRGRRRR
ncbi:DUF6531 domain-containing protein [Amycolatopsis albispora]|uniref:Type IV secretion protein Rhs n=1 Tax=Amycolatopsis albispora TaxID=1804986 RepID=A0A344LFR5_9PSEU|nr:DUF6531 domain-containing protein [Amycolatopsis albispora]AXB46889.1 type IV secretion protein Rhs [Amycolatopsis albispora]